MMESLMSKSEFMAFAKAFTGDQLRDSEMSEFMIHYAKQRASAIAKRIGGDNQNTNEDLEADE